jgi:hypothetical protein
VSFSNFITLHAEGDNREFPFCNMRLFAVAWQDEEIEKHVSYSAVRAGYENAVLFLLCDILKQMLEHTDWTLLRLRAEYTAMTHFVGDGLQTSKLYHQEQWYRNIKFMFSRRIQIRMTHFMHFYRLYFPISMGFFACMGASVLYPWPWW